MERNIYRRVINVILLFVAGCLVAQLAGVLIIRLFGEEMFMKYGMLVSYPLMFIPAMAYNAAESRKGKFFGRGYDLDNNHFEPLDFSSCAILVSLATVATSFITDPVTEMLPEMPQNLKDTMENLIDGPLWVAVLSTCVLAPFFEEWLCRGTVLRGLLAKMKPVYAILLSALFFSLIHLNPWQGIPAFVLGCLFGWVYYRTGSLKLTMLMHCVNNSVSVLVSRIFGSEIESFRALFESGLNYWAVYVSFALMLALILKSLSRISPEGLDKGESI